MCGIAGIAALAGGRQASRAELESMVDRLAPRGPDGRGFLLRPEVGLGHARLSIIDLEGGQQPISNEDATVWTVFNGEIFNYLELRAELEARGHRFRTSTDTEVIVHLYEEHGEDFVHHLNGQFAIALWDEPRRKLLLVRDRPGILPLYYTRSEGRLLFASEVKALLPVLPHTPALNPQALDQLMTFWAPLSPNTLFEGVHEVSPGEMVVVRDGALARRCYWDWEFPTSAADYLEDSEESLVEQLREALIDATRIRLRADVPVGAYLSGGLDSSSITALIHRHSDTPLRTFSIGFEDESLDEAVFQRAMIEHLQADHSSIRCSGEDIARHFVDTVHRTEAPILRTAPVPMALLSGLVRSQGYKVVLTGEGADEVLGGYDIFKEGKIRQFWARRMDSSWRPLLLKKLYPYLDITQRQGLGYLRQFFGRDLQLAHLPWFAHVPRWTTTSMCKEFFSAELAAQLRGQDPIGQLEAALPAQIRQWHPFNQSQYIEAKLLMGGYLLCSQGDRMLMANSVEGRFPFLDHRLIEFAARLHPKWKMRGLNEKYLLKKAMAPYLPAGIVNRHKQPYRAPNVSSFLTRPGLELMDDYLSRSMIHRYGYFDPSRVERLVKKAKLGRAIGHKDNMALVGILSTQVWHHVFVEQRGAQAASARSDAHLTRASLAGGIHGS